MFLGGAGSLSALPASQPPLLFFRGSGGFTALVPTVRSRSQLRRIHRGVIFFYISYFSVYLYFLFLRLSDDAKDPHCSQREKSKFKWD